MRLLTATAIVALAACGTKVKSSKQVPVAPTTEQSIQAELDRITPMLLECDGGPTDNGNNNLSSRPQCDTGDSILPLGLLSTVAYKESYDTFLRESLGPDGRPYRSPEHARACADPANASNSNCSFSRDHLLGHVLFAISQHKCDYLEQIFDYAQAHSGQFCDGTMAQCSISLPIYDVIGDAYATCGLSRPMLTKINDHVAAYTEILNVATNSGFSVELAVDYIYAKLLAGTLITAGTPVVQKAVKQQPTNLYFQYVLNRITDKNIKTTDAIGQNLIPMMQAYTKPGTVWVWQWIDEPHNANGWDYYFMAKLLLQAE